MITVKHLQHLLAIIEQGTIHRAAESLHLTHTAVTRSLNKLEEGLGVALFERSKAGMTPTAFCLQITGSCQQVLVDIGEIKREADIYRNLSGGLLRIAVGKAARGLILRDTLPLFHARYPKITVHITEDTPEQLVESLHGRELDIVIAGSGSYRDVEDLSLQLLQKIPMSILVRPGHPLITEIEAGLQCLIHYPLVGATMIGKSHPVYKLLSTYLEVEQKESDRWPTIMCSDYPTIENILVSSDACLIGPVREFSRQLAEGRLVSIDIPGRDISLDLSVIEIANRMRSPAAQAFIDICEAHFHEFPNATGVCSLHPE